MAPALVQVTYRGPFVAEVGAETIAPGDTTYVTESQAHESAWFEPVAKVKSKGKGDPVEVEQ